MASIEEMQSQFPSDAVYYTDPEDTQQSTEATPPMVKIPYRMMLDVLLESLGLPVAEYRTKVRRTALFLHLQLAAAAQGPSSSRRHVRVSISSLQP